MSQHPIPVLLYEVIQDLRARNPDRIPLIGVAGAQGSGKSYQCRLLTMANQPRFAHFSLDDVYLTKAEREERAFHYCAHMVTHRIERIDPLNLEERKQVAKDLYPLFVTRGPPGTHDLALARGVIARLAKGLTTLLPKFDKATDDRMAETDWPLFRGPAEAILVDGWCLGAHPLPDSAWSEPPLNQVEQLDRGGDWRSLMSAELRQYASFFAGFDAIVYLRPPNWEIVRTWRGQQEEQLLGRPLIADENAKLDRFLMHYERITRWMMAGHHSAKWIVHLDEARNVTRIEER